MTEISEKQPLLEPQQVLVPRRQRDRSFHAFFAFRRTLLLIVLLLLVAGGPVVHKRRRFKTHADVQDYFLKKGPNASSAQKIARSLTAFSHLAGTAGDLKTVSILRQQWEKALGVEHSEAIYESGSRESQSAFALGKRHPSVHVDTYYTLLNYPLGNSSLSLVDESGETVFNASLKERSFEGHEQSDVPVFHGFSKAGQASGRLIYANYGTRDDFERLKREGVDLNGAILIVKYGNIFRGLKVGQAEDAGAAGVLIYSDPGDDGEMTIENGYKAYPDGPARQPSSVQRGSVQFLSLYPGDPLTPGEPSYKNATRLDPDSPGLSKPQIPSIPISYGDALPLLRSLNGHGMQITEWQGGLSNQGVEYFTGPSKAIVQMNNQIEEKINPIWNAYAIVPGTSAEEEIVFLGNHRDAWDKGASDPISGTAAMTQVIEGVGALWKKGWRPRRTLVFASWDAEEYGLIGSTEFGEDFAEMIKARVMLYMNVDVAAAGSIFKFASSPSLVELFREVTAKVPAPDEKGKTVADYMTGQQRQLGSGSDYTVFLQHLGIPSVDVGFTFSKSDPVYHYHSMYDSEHWIEQYGDPGHKRNVAIARIMGLAALRASTDLVMPFNMLDCSNELSNNVEKIRHLASNTEPSKGSFEHLNITALHNAVQEVHLAATGIMKEVHSLQAEELINQLEKDHHSKRKTAASAKGLNKRLKEFELAFISEDGLPNRSWYKHLGIAPGRWLGYGGTTFPGLAEAIELDTDGFLAEEELKRLTCAIKRAAEALRG